MSGVGGVLPCCWHGDDGANGVLEEFVFGAAEHGLSEGAALFITELALTEPVEQSNAKLAILLASLLAAGTSTVILMRGPRPRLVDQRHERAAALE